MGQVLGDVLTTRSHLGVQLKRLKPQSGRDLGLDLFQRLIQGRQPDRAPRAGDVGDEVNGDVLGHD